MKCAAPVADAFSFAEGFRGNVPEDTFVFTCWEQDLTQAEQQVAAFRPVVGIHKIGVPAHTADMANGQQPAQTIELNCQTLRQQRLNNGRQAPSLPLRLMRPLPAGSPSDQTTRPKIDAVQTDCAISSLYSAA
jgi:hypothetical protein